MRPLAFALLLVLALLLEAASPDRLVLGPPQPPHGRRHIVDAQQRQRLVRGVNIGVEWWGDHGRPIDPKAYAAGRCPPLNTRQDAHWSQPPVCEVDAGRGKWNQSTDPLSRNDLAQIRALGFTAIRLAISWSLLEPAPGRYSDMYLDRIEQVVGWAAEQDMHTIVDLHQDNYAYFVPGGGADGAPAWACPAPSAYNDSSVISSLERQLLEKILGDHTDYLNPLIAFETFWRNAEVRESPFGGGLQEHYARAVAQVVRRLRDNDAVLGYELMNEPLPGVSLANLDPFTFANETLYPFYRRLAQALTGVRDSLPPCPPLHPWPVCKGPPASCRRTEDLGCAVPDLGTRTEQILFFEPIGLRNEFDISPQRITSPWTSYSNIVYAPHTYTGSFTLIKHGKLAPQYNVSLDTAWEEAVPMNAGVFVTEFGSTPQSASSKLARIVEEQDKHLTGSTFWIWKESGGGWGLFDGPAEGAPAGTPNGQLRPDYVAQVSRVLPLATVGTLDSFRYNAFLNTTQIFAMQATAPAADSAAGLDAESLVYIPAHVDRADGELEASGSAKLAGVDRQPDGSRVVRVAVVRDGGKYKVTLG